LRFSNKKLLAIQPRAFCKLGKVFLSLATDLHKVGAVGSFHKVGILADSLNARNRSGVAVNQLAIVDLLAAEALTDQRHFQGNSEVNGVFHDIHKPRSVESTVHTFKGIVEGNATQAMFRNHIVDIARNQITGVTREENFTLSFTSVANQLCHTYYLQNFFVVGVENARLVIKLSLPVIITDLM